MDELEEGLPQEEQGEAVEEATEEASEEVSEEQPELKGASVSEVEELRKKLKSQDRAISRQSTELEQARGQRELIERMQSQQEETNARMQDLFSLIKGDEVEPPKPASAYDKLLQERASKPAPQPQLSQADQKTASAVFGLIELRGWEVDSPDVQKARNMDTPGEALEYLKGVAKKEDEKATAEKVTLEVQKQLKAHGLTGGGNEVPRGASMNDAEFLDKFGKGDIPYTKENLAKANKIMEA